MPNTRPLLRLAWPLLHVGMALVILILVAVGMFIPIAAFPFYFGIAWAILGLISFSFRRYRENYAVILLLSGMTLSFAAPVVQEELLSRDLEQRESSAMDALAGKLAPPLVSSYRLNADTFQLSRDGLLVVNFWATWCPPCVEEMPLLDSFANAQSGRIDVVGVTALDGEPDAALQEIRQFVSNTAVSFPILIADDWTNHHSYGVRTLPTTILIEDGRFLDYGIGIAGTRRILELARERSAHSDPAGR